MSQQMAGKRVAMLRANRRIPTWRLWAARVVVAFLAIGGLNNVISQYPTGGIAGTLGALVGVGVVVVFWYWLLLWLLSSKEPDSD